MDTQCVHDFRAQCRNAVPFHQGRGADQLRRRRGPGGVDERHVNVRVTGVELILTSGRRALVAAVRRGATAGALLVWHLVRSSDVRRPPRLRWLVLIIAVCVLGGLSGSGLVQFQSAAAAQPPAGLMLDVDDIERADGSHGSSTTWQQSSRAATRHHAVRRLGWLPFSSVSLPAWGYRLGVASSAPAIVLAGQQLLTYFCVDRR